MTDRDKVERAPERIWAQPEAIGPCAGWDYEGTWHICEGAIGGVEFVRADLFTALQAERDALWEALSAAVEDLDAWVSHRDDMISSGYDVDHTAAVADRARAALHQTERDG